MTGTFRVFEENKQETSGTQKKSQNRKYERKFNHLFLIPTLQYITQILSKIVEL